jgi:PadR family transcriptional regulator PadR
MADKNYFFHSVGELIVLSLLEQKDCYVYEIVKTIEEKSGGIFSITMNTLYTTTYRLEEEGYIAEYSKKVGKKRTRVYYHLNDRGAEYLETLRQAHQNNIDALERILNTKFIEE